MSNVKGAPSVREEYFFSDANFLIVARRFFAKDVIGEVRQKIKNREGVLDPSGLSKQEKERARAGLASDQLRLDKAWYAVWDEADISCLEKFVPDYNQLTFPPQIRTVRDRASFTPWHQDEAYMLQLGDRAHRDIITCFVPLDDKPFERPTVQFCLDKGQVSIPHVLHPEAIWNRYEIPPAYEPGDEDCISFDLESGDALFFGKHVLHRTFFKSPAFPERQSMEFRLTKNSNRIKGKDYFDLKRKSFYVHEPDHGTRS